jgi:hypothetical protein
MKAFTAGNVVKGFIGAGRCARETAEALASRFLSTT